MLPNRLFKKIEFEPNTGCWLWVGAWRSYRHGYGAVKEIGGGPLRVAHRYMYELLRGPIPPELQIDHLCRIRSCVNPWHLELVTCRENLLRSDLTVASKQAAKKVCLRGHVFRSTQKGGRYRRCLECSNTQQLLRRGGRKTAQQRSEQGRKAAFALWAKRRT